MTLTAQVRVTVGALTLDVELEIERGVTLAVVGPNGAGKTTLIRALAGLTPIDAGRIVLDDRVLDEPRAGTFVPSERRDVGVVFQNAALFPHLSVLDNVAFGLRSSGSSRSEARRVAAHRLTELGLDWLSPRRPATLSAGEAQRAELVRALVGRPRLLLLDEPMAAVDAAARPSLRADLARQIGGFEGVRVLVTHDAVEALALADRIAVLEEGRLVQEGSAADVAAHPRSAYAAAFVGVNLLDGRSTGDGLIALDSGGVVTSSATPEGDVLVLIRPTSVSLHSQRPAGSPRNAWPSVVAGVDRAAHRVRVQLAGAVPLVAEITPAAADELELRPGLDLYAVVKASEVEVVSAGAARAARRE